MQLAEYGALFVGHWGHYAVQQRDGSYVRVPEPVTYELLTGHLLGRWTVGTYLLDEQSRCSCAVLDADGQDGLAVLRQVGCRLAADGVWSLLEASRRGGHLWVLLDGLTAARLVRAWLLPYAADDGLELHDQSFRRDGHGRSRQSLGHHRRELHSR